MSRLRFRPFVLFGSLLLATAPVVLTTRAAADTADAPRDLHKLVAEICASCHGPNLEGAVGPSLLDAKWKYGGDDAHIATSIRVGYPASGMPGFGGALTTKEISEVVAYLRELANKAAQRRSLPPSPTRKP